MPALLAALAPLGCSCTRRRRRLVLLSEAAIGQLIAESSALRSCKVLLECLRSEPFDRSPFLQMLLVVPRTDRDISVCTTLHAWFQRTSLTSLNEPAVPLHAPHSSLTSLSLPWNHHGNAARHLATRIRCKIRVAVASLADNVSLMFNTSVDL